MNRMKIRKYHLFQGLYWGILFPVVTFVLLEIVLQLAALVLPLFSDRIMQTGWMNTGGLRVLAVGDSNTYGTYLKLEESYPKQLEQLWNNVHSQKIEVINAGYPGTSSSGIVKNLPHLLEVFDPDVTLVMIGTNDFWTEPEPELAGQLQESRWLNRIKKYSRVWKLYQLINKHQFNETELISMERIPADKAVLERMQSVDKQNLETINQGLRSDMESNENRQIRYQGKSFDFSSKLATEKKPDLNLDPRKILENNLIAIAKFSEQNGQRIVFISYAGNKFFYKAANRALARAHEANRFPYVDVTSTFQQLCPDHHICPEYLFFDQHATAAGNRIVAEVVMKYLEDFVSHE